jgi:hypothetical protein
MNKQLKCQWCNQEILDEGYKLIECPIDDCLEIMCCLDCLEKHIKRNHPPKKINPFDYNY